MKIGVAIATTGRPDVLAAMLRRLAGQTRAPDLVLVVGAGQADFPASPWNDGGAEPAFPTDFVVAPRGSSRQRNHALDLFGTAFDLIVFFDDDFVPARDFLAGAERLFADNPEIVAASGHLLADGFRSPGISFAEADRLIAAYESDGLGKPAHVADQPGAYGCNMVVRIGALPQARFDEDLPLYGWLEDLDFSARLAKLGRIVEAGACVGVHLGVKSGRSPGLQVGYSHVANPLYLAKKGAISQRRAITMAVKVLIANSLRSLAPEPYIDRRGRLMGNLIAIGDLLLGRMHPTRILDFSPRVTGQTRKSHALS